MKADINKLIEEKIKQVERRLEYNDPYLAGKRKLELGFLYEYTEQWKVAENCYIESLSLLNEGIKKQSTKLGKITVQNVLNLMFPKYILQCKLSMDFKARETIETILTYYNEDINRFQSGDKGIYSSRIRDIAICYFFLENFTEAYNCSKFLVDIAIEHKRLENHGYINIMYLLSKAKIERDIDLAKIAKKYLFKYVRGQ